jgi:hypothetical protein
MITWVLGGSPVYTRAVEPPLVPSPAHGEDRGTGRLSAAPAESQVTRCRSVSSVALLRLRTLRRPSYSPTAIEYLDELVRLVAVLVALQRLPLPLQALTAPVVPR